MALAVALNGTIQAVTQPWNLPLNGRQGSWAAVVPETAFQAGPNTVEVFVVSDVAGQTSLARATELSYRLAGSPPTRRKCWCRRMGGPSRSYAKPCGRVEPPRVSTDTILLKGWAVDETHAQPAEQILIFLNERFSTPAARAPRVRILSSGWGSQRLRPPVFTIRSQPRSFRARLTYGSLPSPATPPLRNCAMSRVIPGKENRCD